MVRYVLAISHYGLIHGLSVEVTLLQLPEFSRRNVNRRYAEPRSEVTFCHLVSQSALFGILGRLTGFLNFFLQSGTGGAVDPPVCL